jgi:hypothetical protein
LIQSNPDFSGSSGNCTTNKGVQTKGGVQTANWYCLRLSFDPLRVFYVILIIGTTLETSDLVAATTLLGQSCLTSGFHCTKDFVRSTLDGYAGKVANVTASSARSRVVLANASNGKEIVVGQEIVMFGGIRGYKMEFLEPSAVVTESAIPKPIEERTPIEFHEIAVATTQGAQAKQYLVKGLSSFLISQIDSETGTKKVGPEIVVGCKEIAKGAIDFGKAHDVADIEVGYDELEDQNREHVEHYRSRSWTVEVHVEVHGEDLRQ